VPTVKRLRDTRRTIVIAALAACGGFCLASATAQGGIKLRAWREFGELFQLGYVVGYIDAASLAKRHDMRVYGVPTGGKVDYELWRSRVNEFFADPAHANAQVPDAMRVVGKKFQDEILKNRREARVPSPSPAASPAAAEGGAAVGPADAPGASRTSPTLAPGASRTPHAPAVP
jgi:hypothetical protein